MHCPNCEFDGEFSKARPRFLVFDFWDSLIERSRACRSVGCPRCAVTITFPPKPGENRVVFLVFLVAIALPYAAFFGTYVGSADLPRFPGISMREKTAILAVALTLLPVAVAAWIKKSRGLFVAGAIAAAIGLFFAGVGTVDWDHDATERSMLIAYTGWNLLGTMPAAALGLLFGWHISCRDASPPTDDWGRR
jgi:hypothetical protein